MPDNTTQSTSTQPPLGSLQPATQPPAVIAGHKVTSPTPKVTPPQSLPASAAPPAGTTSVKAESKPITPPYPAPTALQPERRPKTQEELLRSVEKYVKTEPVAGRFSYRGYCDKCGFQSYQFTQADAENIIRAHVTKHIGEDYV